MKRQRLLLVLGAAVLLAVTATIIVLVIKTRRLGEARDELAWRIGMYCSSLAWDLTSEAKQQAQGLEYLRHPELNDDQRRAIDQTYFTSPITGDVTRSGRFAAAMALWNRFHFCLQLRGADKKKLDELDRKSVV